MLDLAITELKKRGRAKAEAEASYRMGLSKQILIQREEGLPVTIISDVCRGNEYIAKLKMERDIAETYYETCKQKIYQLKLELGIIENQMNMERKGS
jgi:hypothetical protein